ncbi:MAG: GAF domain-containing protein [Deltaproteobacteria bacterium]|nr:MAG: GAF domain-containing protein [Deltaproteobacteria bacterium]
MRDERSAAHASSDELIDGMSRGLELTKDLIRENERLRQELLELHTQQAAAAREPAQWEERQVELVSRVEALQGERNRLIELLRRGEQKTRRVAGQCSEVEEEINRLANFHVASSELHASLDLREVVNVILEILINLIGADVFALYACDEEANHLERIAVQGKHVELPARVPLDDALIARSLASGETAFGPAEEGRGAAPLASVPLCMGERRIGAIVIHRLLQQKHGFTPLDRQLLELLSGHAATALFAAQLYGDWKRQPAALPRLTELLGTGAARAAEE